MTYLAFVHERVKEAGVNEVHRPVPMIKVAKRHASTKTFEHDLLSVLLIRVENIVGKEVFPTKELSVVECEFVKEAQINRGAYVEPQSTLGD